MSINTQQAPKKLPIVVLISGQGTTLQALIDAANEDLNIDICAVISNQDDAFGLQRAKQAGISVHAIPHQNYPSRRDFELALQQQIEHYQPKLIVLAGFMRRLESEFVTHYRGRMINIHPSLLPKYPGLNTYQHALAAGDTEHGTSIHFVTDEVDGGPVIAQAKLLIHPGETKDGLKQRVQALERRIYPQVLDWFVHGRVALANHEAELDGKRLPKNGMTLN